VVVTAGPYRLFRMSSTCICRIPGFAHLAEERIMPESRCPSSPMIRPREKPIGLCDGKLQFASPQVLQWGRGGEAAESRKTSGELARSRDCSWIAQSIEQTVTVAATVRKPSKARKNLRSTGRSSQRPKFKNPPNRRPTRSLRPVPAPTLPSSYPDHLPLSKNAGGLCRFNPNLSTKIAPATPTFISAPRRAPHA